MPREQPLILYKVKQVLDSPSCSFFCQGDGVTNYLSRMEDLTDKTYTHKLLYFFDILQYKNQNFNIQLCQNVFNIKSYEWKRFLRSWTKCPKNQPYGVILMRDYQSLFYGFSFQLPLTSPSFYDVTWLIFETLCLATFLLLFYKPKIVLMVMLILIQQ